MDCRGRSHKYDLHIDVAGECSDGEEATIRKKGGITVAMKASFLAMADKLNEEEGAPPRPADVAAKLRERDGAAPDAEQARSTGTLQARDAVFGRRICVEKQTVSHADMEMPRAPIGIARPRERTGEDEDAGGRNAISRIRGCVSCSGGRCREGASRGTQCFERAARFEPTDGIQLENQHVLTLI